jgi:hypothetical protein
MRGTEYNCSETEVHKHHKNGQAVLKKDDEFIEAGKLFLPVGRVWVNEAPEDETKPDLSR